VAIGEPVSLLPGEATKVDALPVLSTLYTGLVTLNDQGGVEMAAAESMTSDDQRNWTVRLRKGWTFHDGSPMTADSFIDAWNWIAYGPNGQANGRFLDRVEGFEQLQAPTGGGTPKATKLTGLVKVDDHTFTVRLKQPFSQFPALVSFIAFIPQPPAFFQDTDPKKTAFRKRPIGNGPYRREGSWKHNQQIEVRRFDAYQGANKPSNRGITFKIFTSPEAMFSAFRADQVDLILRLTSAQLPQIARSYPNNLVERNDATGFTYLSVPLYQKKFSSREIRAAISMAIDRETIASRVFAGLVIPAGAIIAPAAPRHRDDACGETCKLDPEGAKAALQRAGGLTGGLQIFYNAAIGQGDWVKAVATSVQENLGIQAEAVAVSQTTEYLDRAVNHRFTGPFALSWDPDYISPENYMRLPYGTGSHRTGPGSPTDRWTGSSTKVTPRRRSTRPCRSTSRRRT